VVTCGLLPVMNDGDMVSRWRRAGEQGDAEAAAACLHQDVTLISPLTEQFRFQGREQVRVLLSAAFTAISGIHFHTEVRQDSTVALFYRGRVGHQEMEEAQLLRLDETGHIREVTRFIRTLPALTALMSALGPELARRRGNRPLAALLAASTAPLHAMTRLGDRGIVPLAAPDR
jgi:hypothetical protein